MIPPIATATTGPVPPLPGGGAAGVTVASVDSGAARRVDLHRDGGREPRGRGERQQVPRAERGRDLVERADDP